MKKYFYCQSYQAFNLAIKLNQETDVVVITGAPNIIKACEYLKIEYLVHTDYPGLELVKQHNKVKRDISNLLETIGNNELHFSHTQFAVFCFILINEAVKNRMNIFFHDFEFVYTRVKTLPIQKSSLSLLLKYQAIKYLFKVPLQLGMSTPGANMICLDLKILNNSNITLVHDKNDYFNETLRLFKTIQINVEPIKTLFVAQTFDDSGFFRKDKIDEVLQMLNTEKTHIKMHPKIANGNILAKCHVLPDFLPVEFFFSAVSKCVISFHSASLVTAAQFSNLQAISLIDLVGVESEFNQKVKIDLMMKSTNRILFPKTIEELTVLIND